MSDEQIYSLAKWLGSMAISSFVLYKGFTFWVKENSVGKTAIERIDAVMKVLEEKMKTIEIGFEKHEKYTKDFLDTMMDILKLKR